MKTRLHVPASEEPCTPCKLLQARRYCNCKGNITQGRERRPLRRSVSQSSKTALAESWKMQQIRKGGSRWDHKRKGHQFYWQRRLIFKLHAKTLLQKHLTCVSLVAPIMSYVGQREYLEIPLTEFPPRLFLSSFSLDFFHPFLIHFSVHVSDEELLLLLLSSPLPPHLLSAISLGFFCSCIHQSWIQWQPLGNFSLLVTQVIGSGALGSCQAWCHSSAEKNTLCNCLIH